MISFELFNLITAPELLDFLDVHLPIHRKSQYPKNKILSMFLSQAMSADRLCQNAVNNLEVRSTTPNRSAAPAEPLPPIRAHQLFYPNPII